MKHHLNIFLLAAVLSVLFTSLIGHMLVGDVLSFLRILLAMLLSSPGTFFLPAVAWAVCVFLISWLIKVSYGKE